MKSDNPDLGLQLLDELIDPNYDFLDLSCYNEGPEEDYSNE